MKPSVKKFFFDSKIYLSITVMALLFSIFSSATFAAGREYPPILATGAKVPATVIGAYAANSNGQTGAGLFDGTTVDEWNTNRIFYWYGSSSYLEVSFPRSVNIWRYGTASWSGQNAPLSILKFNSSDNSYTDVTSTYSLPVSAISHTQAEKFVQHLPAGRYKFKLASGLRIDSEWYVENDGVGPAVPLDLKGTGGDGVANLTWTANTESNLQGYYVYKNGVKLFDTPIRGTSYSVGFLTNGTSYSFQISAVDNLGNESAWSTAVPVTPITNPPAVPTGLSATSANSQVSLVWNTVSGATGYHVKRSTSSNGPYTVIASVYSSTYFSTYIDNTVTNGTTYYYVISAWNSGGESGHSNEASVKPQVPAPSTPTYLAAAPGDSQVTLNWSSVTGATYYIIKRSITYDGSYSVISNSVTGTTYADVRVTNGGTYFYVVQAANAGGAGPGSNQVSATPKAPLPPVPSPPYYLTGQAGNAQNVLNWGTSVYATGYQIKRSATAGGPYSLIAVTSATYLTDSSVTNGSTYYYVVTATNAAGESANSNEIALTPTAPTTGLPYPTNLAATTGNAQVTLSWTAATGASSYLIKRATSNSGPYSTIATGVTATSYTDTSVVSGTTYYYVVSAIVANKESNHSNSVEATPTTTVESNRALLEITMVSGQTFEYDLSMDEVNNFTTWYNHRASGTGPAFYTMNKTYNLGPFTSRKDNLVFDKIQSFEVNEYKK